eukprot:jgi/Psemu1/283511/fgenesh1_pg.28_\
MNGRKRIVSDTNRIVRRRKSTASTSDAGDDVSFQQKLRTFMNRPRTVLNQTLSLTQVLGRTSYIFTIAAFAENDILDLRAFALFSSTLSLGYQWFGRPIPSKYPLYWSALLMSINGYMASSLYFEREKAEHMGEELEEIYRAGDFERRGFGRVEFLKFFDGNGDCAPNKYRKKQNEILVLEDSINTKLFYVIEGRASVQVPTPGGEDRKQQLRHVAWVDENEFIGEMSMLDALDKDSLSIERASARVVAGERGVTVYEWDLQRLRKYMWERQNQPVSNALQANVCHDLRHKLRKSTDTMVKRRSTTHC